jgi:ribose transport system substrate-binding protein
MANPFFAEIERGARLAEKELGIKLLVHAAAQATSVDQQIQIVDGLIRDQVDAIVIAPIHSVDLIPVVKKAQDQGVVVVNIDNRLDPVQSERSGLADVPFISTDNFEGAYLAARYISQEIDHPVDAVILEGVPSAQNADDRKMGALKAFRENRMVHVLVSETAHWKIEEAYEVTRDLFERYPGISLMFCANDLMALGAIEYLQETGNTTVRVAGFDALDEAKQAILDGSLAVTIDQRPAEQGYLGIYRAFQLLSGQEVELETILDPVLIDPDTLSQSNEP